MTNGFLITLMSIGFRTVIPRNFEKFCKSYRKAQENRDQDYLFRSSHQRCSGKKDDLKNFRPATLLKKRLCRKCFLVNFVKFSRTPFLQNASGQQLLPFRRLCHRCFP